MSFHHGWLETSPRLRKLLEFLKDRGPIGATTLDLAEGCVSTRPSSDISELRACGVQIETQYVRKTETGRRVYRYRLKMTQATLL